ncbi:DNA-3-methyladenine glycosylase I [Marinomonas epiphytica]
MNRCNWVNDAPDFPRYHDEEWGWPVANDQKLFEKLCLESFQSGLSWRTILSKREHFREAFKHFDPYEMARFTAEDIASLKANAKIVRNQRKIEAVINNAKRAIEIINEHGSLAKFLWQFEPSESSLDDLPRTTCPEAMQLARKLKKRGWKFVGPTTIYAFMQSMGMVNDHEAHCEMRLRITKARAEFIRP